jgi:hypothetical protein
MKLRVAGQLAVPGDLEKDSLERTTSSKCAHACAFCAIAKDAILQQRACAAVVATATAAAQRAAKLLMYCQATPRPASRPRRGI